MKFVPVPALDIHKMQLRSKRQDRQNRKHSDDVQVGERRDVIQMVKCVHCNENPIYVFLFWE